MPDEVFTTLWRKDSLTDTERRMLVARPLSESLRSLVLAHPNNTAYMLQLFVHSNPDLSHAHANHLSTMALTNDARHIVSTRLSCPRELITEPTTSVCSTSWSPPHLPVAPDATIAEAVTDHRVDPALVVRSHLGDDPDQWAILLDTLAFAPPNTLFREALACAVRLTLLHR